MLEIFKGWVSAMLCLGIFVTFVQLIIPKTNLKKYIYSLIGIITIITVVSPVISSLKEKNIDQSVSDVIANISNYKIEDASVNSNIDSYASKTEETVRENFAKNLKQDVKNKLEEKGISVISIDIFLTEQYNIEKLSICINKINANVAKLSDVTKVVTYINEQYDLDFSKIEVIEEGE